MQHSHYVIRPPAPTSYRTVRSTEDTALLSEPPQSPQILACGARSSPQKVGTAQQPPQTHKEVFHTPRPTPAPPKTAVCGREIKRLPSAAAAIAATMQAGSATIMPSIIRLDATNATGGITNSNAISDFQRGNSAMAKHPIIAYRMLLDIRAACHCAYGGKFTSMAIFRPMAWGK